MDSRGENRERSLGARIRRLLGTIHFPQLVKLLRRQNEGVDKLREEVKQLSKLVAAQNRAIERNAKHARKSQSEALETQRNIASASAKLAKLSAAEKSRLDQISYSLFELNKTLYAMYKAEDFDLGSAGQGFFSQNGEDGIIGEIARRLEMKIETFVEIGTGDGTENNSIHLLLGGARGLWVEADGECVKRIEDSYSAALAAGQLKVVQSLVDAENINSILGDAGISGEVDFLSLDIDGNDYWVWEALTVVSPKILCLEYNAFYGPFISWTKTYQADFRWPGRNIYYGASLKALETLSSTKGYTLVACDYSGVNAFFVRNDLLNGSFHGPFAAEHLFQPFRGVIGRRPPTKEVVFGPYENV